MSDEKKGDTDGDAPSAETVRAINARIDEIEGRQRKDEEDERQHNISQLRVNRTIAVFTALLFVTSAISEVYLIRSANAAKSAADTAAKQLLIADRPWITAANATLAAPIEYPPAARFMLKATITLKNSGLSIAQNGLMMPDAEPDYTAILAKDSYKSCASAKDMLAIKAKTTPWETGFVLAPADTILVPVSMGADNISHQQVLLGQFYIIGCVVYRDQFSVDHHTRFCFQPTRPIADPGKIDFRACDWYGEAN